MHCSSPREASNSIALGSIFLGFKPWDIAAFRYSTSPALSADKNFSLSLKLPLV